MESSPKWPNVSGSWEVDQESQFTIGTSALNLPLCLLMIIGLVDDAASQDKVHYNYNHSPGDSARSFASRLAPSQASLSNVLLRFFGVQRLKVLNISWGEEVALRSLRILWLKWCWDRMTEIQFNMFWNMPHVVWLLQQLMHVDHLHQLINICLKTHIPMSLGPTPNQ